MKKLIRKLHQSKVMGAIFHTLDNCLQNELKGCETVLDLGCGPSSPLKNCRNIKYSIGVEAFKEYLLTSKKQKIHNKYILSKIEELKFPDNSFDAVIMIEVLEHLPKAQGSRILKQAEKWSRKKVIVSSPNGFIKQQALDNNPLQKHLSGWNLFTMKRLGFRVRGLAGLKSLRQEVSADTMGDDFTTSIRLKPRFFWFLIATMSQLITYYISFIAFELFSVKIKSKK